MAGMRIVASILVGLALTAGRAQETKPAAPAVTAIGDVHGDFETLRMLLRKTGLTDARDRWAGGKRHWVQTGDFLDRGAGSRRVMDLLMRLEEESKAAGGQVTVLLGNHEVMNLTGDLVSTTREEFAAYQDLEDAAERGKSRQRILALLKRGSPLLVSGYLSELSRALDAASFDRFFPPGFFGHRSALRPTGKYGRWLLTHKFVHREAGALFLHGGLSQAYGFIPVEQLNSEMRLGVLRYRAALEQLEKLGVFDEAFGFRELLWLMSSERKAGGPRPELREAFREIDSVWNGVAFSEDGPLWYRGLANGDERGLWRTVEEICRWHGVERIVIGHTQPESLRVEPRFGNRVILIDTGMNQAVYRGTPSAVLIEPTKPVQVWE